MTEGASIILDWLYKLWVDKKVRIFTVTYSGIINELVKEDFEFIRRLSSTCKISAFEDNRILAKNKPDIALRVYKGYRFTTDEIRIMYTQFKNDKKVKKFSKWLCREGRSEREYELHKIIDAISSINSINKILYFNTDDITVTGAVREGFELGLFKRDRKVSTTDKYVRINFVDKHNIAEYFPGYLRQKEVWDLMRTRSVNQKMFYAIVRGEYRNFAEDYKLQTNIEEAWK